MKKDIEIPKVEGVYMAICHQYNSVFKSDDWHAYILNEKPLPLENILIVSMGYDQKNKTAKLRHQLNVLPAKSGAKVELIQGEVLKLTNVFQVTFFIENQLFEKTFIFPKNSINKANIKPIPLLQMNGIMQS
ncbi:hypothetical protein MWU59_00525 [Flavobacteriaceae bacterium F08102]|nr:hypothetical protein [Flavobacteriaceae bacterium F08102]